MEKKSELILSTDYPHGLLTQLSELIRKHGRKILRDQEIFEKEFRRLFPKETKNLKSMQIAYRAGVVEGFIQKNAKALWEKNTFLKMTMVHLTRYMEEEASVQVVESLMHIFQWEFRVSVERTWKTTGKIADFHKADQIRRMSLGRREIDEIEQQIKESQEASENEGGSGKERGAGTGSSGRTGGVSVSEEHEKRGRQERVVSSRAGTQKTGGSHRMQGNASQKAETRDGGSGAQNLQDEKTSRPEIPAKIKHEGKMSLTQRKSAKKAQKGKADAQCELGDFYMEEGTDHLDYVEAERWYLLSSEQGYLKARFQLGQLYNKGEGSVKDPEKEALRYFLKLAEENYPTAQCVLGIKYQMGQGVEVDLNKSVGYFKKAALQGHNESQRRLGDIYIGMGNTEEAARWYRMAAKSGDAYAAAQLKRFKL